ncbi:MAG: hypothetical protein RJB66_1196 [Pseudomonadota bacterium]|jgi:FtsP/CotA-like multicopper oxidase with cupredoxin domain
MSVLLNLSFLTKRLPLIVLTTVWSLTSLAYQVSIKNTSKSVTASQFAPKDENVHLYELVIDYIPSKDDSRPIGLYLKNEPENGPRFPGPTLYFEEGETAVVRVFNRLPEETSIHWHGIILPNNQDGVPHITTKPIAPFNPKNPNKYFEYKFKIVQNGTYWYHSHSAYQEQRGLFGPIVIFPAEENHSGGHQHEHFDYDEVLDFSDYVKRDPEDVLTVLKTDNEREVRQKGTERSLFEDIKTKNLLKRLKCETNGMGPMDIADVAIDAIHANGLKRSAIRTAPNMSEKVKLRLINSSASSLVQVVYGNKRKMKIIASDGLDVTPYETDYIIMAVGETYDVIVDSDPTKKVELRAAVFELKPNVYSSTFIGPENGVKENAPSFANLNPCDHHAANLVYNNIRSTNTAHNRWKWKENSPVKKFNLTLTGDMRANRYVWSMNNGKVFADTEPLMIRKGDRVKVHLVNNTMMFHPIHLHGHFFAITKVGNSGGHGGHGGHGGGEDHSGHKGHSMLMSGDHSDHGNHGDHGGGHDGHPPEHDAAPVLWKHTMIMAPHSEQDIEFYASEDRNWLFHCHNMYHMATGMSVMFSYFSDAQQPGQPPSHPPGHDHHNHTMSAPKSKNSNSDARDIEAAKKLVRGHDEMSGKEGGYLNYDINVLSNQTEGEIPVNINDKLQATLIGKYAYGNTEADEDNHTRARLDLSYYPFQDSYTGLYAGVEDSTGAKGTFGAAGIKTRLFSLETQLGWGSKGIDACVARDVPLVGHVYFYGRYCRQGNTNYYDARVGYHLIQNEGDHKINIDPTCGVNEDGPMCGINIHGGTKIKTPDLFKNIKPIDR